MSEKKELLTTNRKALTINLDGSRNTAPFAEIGAGQEVARVFFQAGGASGTDRQDHLGLRHDVQRRHLRQGPALRVARAARR